MIKKLMVITALLATSSIALADLDNGKKLHDANCVSCHTKMTGGDGSALYTRSKRRVTSSDALTSQVRRCATNLNLTWFDDQIDDVSSYLNQEYYKFPAK
ncbi:MAG: c-type cytochrome [bacterium]